MDEAVGMIAGTASDTAASNATMIWLLRDNHRLGNAPARRFYSLFQHRRGRMIRFPCVQCTQKQNGSPSVYKIVAYTKANPLWQSEGTTVTKT